MWYDVKILVVDDTPNNLDVVTEMLSAIGYGVATAISGDRALKRLQTYAPDLILLDVQMSGIDGFETCRQIKANPETATIPIIFMTAFGDIENKVKGFELGAVDYISKPFQEKELLARVRTHLQLRQWNKTLEMRVAESTVGLQTALEQLKNSQLRLIQSEKMSTLGNLVAGVAHEINNPIGFLNGSIHHAQEYMQDLLHHLELYQQQYPEPAAAIQDHADAVNLDFLCEDLPKLLSSMKSAIARIEELSTGLRTFARSDTEQKISTNLHEGIDSVLMILKYRLKASPQRPGIQVIQEYGELPPIKCLPGQLNQVFMNILANAIDAFDEAAEQSSFAELEANPQIITIRTSPNPAANTIEIRIHDNGVGIPDEVKPRIFEHLFTTKAVGKGTGLGLTIARQIVVNQHQGVLSVSSEPGQGTEFYIQLPVEF